MPALHPHALICAPQSTADVCRPPNQFAGASIKRRKMVFEELPIVPPLEPRQPTALTTGGITQVRHNILYIYI